MKTLRLILKNLLRRKGRTLLAVCGVGSAMMLFVLVESLGVGLERAMSSTSAARTLVVYRKNRYCPQTSFLPQWYTTAIEEIEGVESVLPVKVFLNNCRASLDQITFHGAPVDMLVAARGVELLEGDFEAFRSESDAALVGRDFAARKGLAVGDKFKFGEVDVKIRGIFGAEERVDESVILTHLEFLQRAGPVDRLGTVTQFEVRLAADADAREVARQIDERLATAEEPTDTRPRLAFLESATRDLREVLRFGRMLGLACVVVVLTLVANTVLMSVQERVREFGVFRSLGFGRTHVGTVVIGESLALAVFGGLLGVGGALVVLHTTHLTIGSEGVSVALSAPPELVLRGAAVVLGAGLMAGVFPAWHSSRADIVEALRS